MTITLTKTNADITLDKTSLTFTASNYSRAQVVRVSAARDNDSTNDSDTIRLTASGGITAPEKTIAVSVTDNYSPTPSGAITLSPSGTLTITEGGSQNLSVSLSRAPNASVTITLTKTNADITLDKTSLTFTASDYSTAKVVRVSAARDNDSTDDSDTIRLTASGGISAPEKTIAVSVTDNYSPTPSGAITLSPSGALTITEGGSQNLSVSLSRAPNANVTITLTKTNADITLDKTSLTFTASDYSTAKVVRVSASEDADTTNDSDMIRLTASGGISATAVTKQVLVLDNDTPTTPPPTTTPTGSIILSPAERLTITEGGSEAFGVRLSRAPNASVTITLTKTNADINLSPTSLTFTTSNYSSAQAVRVAAAEDADTTNDSDTITLTASGGITAPAAVKQVLVLDNDTPTTPPPTTTPTGTINISPSIPLVVREGASRTLYVNLSRRPNASVLIAMIKTHPDITLSPTSLTFTPSNYSSAQAVRVSASEDSDTTDESDTITFTASGGIIAPTTTRQVEVIDSHVPTTPIRTQALALPPPDSVDGATLRIQCKQDSPCPVALECSAQRDGEVFEGSLPSSIPARGAVALTMSEIQRYTGGKSWSGKGRLGCALRSNALIGSQVWTRSGEGVLVNNSAMIRSVPEGEVYRADIESIPSPDSSDESNIRIRCNSQTGDCLNTSFVCYSDAGERYDWTLGRITRLHTRHLQSESLSSGIGHRWEGLGLTCEVRSNGNFTAQVLTRTGGGGALVNNSATGQ